MTAEVEEDHCDGCKDEGLEASCGSTARAALRELPHVGSVSLCSATLGVVISVLGAGQLTLPYAFGQIGFGGGLLALLGFTLLSMVSLYTLSVYELHFTAKPEACIPSYTELLVMAMGDGWERTCTAVLNFLICFYAWGGGVSFMIIMIEELGYIASLIWPLSETHANVAGIAALLIISVFFILPLAASEDLSKLKRVSPLGCLAAVLITVVVLICTQWTSGEMLGAATCAGPVSGLGDGEGPSGAEEDLGFEWWSRADIVKVMATLPLFSFALNSSWAFTPVLCSLRGKCTQKDASGLSPSNRAVSLIVLSNAIIFLNYLLLSVYGYLMFCGEAKPNILESLGASVQAGSVQAVLVNVARAALAFQLSMCLPLRFFVARRALGKAVQSKAAARWGSAGLLVASSCAVACARLSLAMVLGITSSVCASMIIYVIPAVVDLRLHHLRLRSVLGQILSVVSLFVGLFILVGGTIANIHGAAVAGG